MVWTVPGHLDGADMSGSGAAWYDSAQAWSRSKGISDGSNPNGSVTRSEAAAILMRFCENMAQ